ncbi:U4/U6.U5 tri-snRNP-associated protein 2-like isoform X1 [Varroa jacobsoni]|uniref:Ubiquitin carboxyl-terminal hydrolase 39 n=2 Tax=Varroa destructor TaxID=109461 RepID=A0A7M7JKJ1_VARDE|nr:U4/U6.U5 tri-snRNP-associated protein 2-like isoform X1 [Varroa destructor]XP_022705517.1 U4/U6.U5 tri-snRNP-associated protein 2-like isoform X1 [Varroa jacobsoni]
MSKESAKSRSCPYLDTINRSVLDFDFEKLCSVSLSRINVYACLVCGKYFQGRGPSTHAYTHSVHAGHHVFLQLESLEFFCLPDNYRVVDSALDDILFVLQPRFSHQDIKELDKTEKLSIALDGTRYLPGIVGLNNIKANDYCNVILQALSGVAPLRDYMLRDENYRDIKRPPGDNMFLIVQRFGELLRKLWNPRHFKAHVSPHEMLQAVVLCSKKRFQITNQGDPVDFLSWFLNSLHIALNGTNKDSSSVIYKTFRGRMRVYSKKLFPTDPEHQPKVYDPAEYEVKEEKMPFMYLTVDLPSQPLFRDDQRENIIPQVPLSVIMAKFNGIQEKEYKTYKDNTLKRFEIIKLPKYLILYMKRFTRNTFFTEKNPTIVNFPIRNVDFGDVLALEARKANPENVYDLVANIVHEGEPNKGTYRCHVLHRGSGKWYELQDLHVTEILPQMITLSESYVQIWQRTSAPFKDVIKGKTNIKDTTIAPTAGEDAGEKVQFDEDNNAVPDEKSSSLPKDEVEKSVEMTEDGKEAFEEQVFSVESHEVVAPASGEGLKGEKGLKRKLEED